MPAPHITTLESALGGPAGTLNEWRLEAIPKGPTLGAGALVQRRLSATPHADHHTVAFLRQRGG